MAHIFIIMYIRLLGKPGGKNSDRLGRWGERRIHFAFHFHCGSPFRYRTRHRKPIPSLHGPTILGNFPVFSIRNTLRELLRFFGRSFMANDDGHWKSPGLILAKRYFPTKDLRES